MRRGVRPGAGITRRQFGTMAAGAIAPFALADACYSGSPAQEPNDGRLTARPSGAGRTAAQGTRALGLDPDRDAILRLPANPAAAPLPLLVLLHGAGGRGERILQRFGAAADAAGVAMLAPDSRETTWDAIRGGFGRDVSFVNRALARLFEIVAVDPARIAIGGFSDGATYALSLGLINGDLFRRVVAFSPGFVVEGSPRGRPRFFVSHGTADPILPIDRCSRAIVAGLRRRGYDVSFREFDGGHDVPAAIAADGLAWVAAAGSSAS